MKDGVHPDYTNKVVFVFGGGNVAMDAARTIKRLGAEKVVIVYRRGETEMPAELKEVDDAKEEGVEFLFHTNLVKICGDEFVEEIECVKTFYDGEMCKENLKNVEGSDFSLKADFVVMAIGSETDGSLVDSLGLALDSRNYIKVDENYLTSDDRVFAVGDLAGVKSTVAWAASSGRNAAESIIKLHKR